MFFRMDETSLQDTFATNRRNIAPGNICPQSRHPVRLPKKIGEVRLSTKIQTKNVFFWMDETSLRDTFAPNRAI